MPSVLARAWQLPNLLHRFPERLVWAGFVFVNGFVIIALLSLLAKVTHTPWVFPSLGPTAILFFFTPTASTATPRNSIFGHALGIACGYFALWLTGLRDAGPMIIVGVDNRRILAAALSLALTGALMIVLNAAHPPAGATTLIISLGVITKPWHLVGIEVAVAALTLQAIIINRVAGIDYPLWSNTQPPRALREKLYTTAHPDPEYR